MPTLKHCSKCKSAHPLDNFNRDRSRNDGRFPWCKPCHRAHTRAYNAQFTTEQRKQRSAEWRANRDANAEARARYLTNGTIYTLKKRYGLTSADMVALSDHQGGVCAVCGRPFESGKRKGPCVDHCHQTGKVRGLLCDHCNVGLGRLRDDPELLRKGIEYLTNPPAEGVLPDHQGPRGNPPRTKPA